MVVMTICSTIVFAQLPYNTTMTESHYNNSSVVVGNDGAQYSQNKWEDGIRLEAKAGRISGSEWNWDDKFVIIALNQTSIPYQLTFKYKCNSIIATNPDWYVEESADNVNWSRIWSTVTPTSSGVSVSTNTYSAGPIDLSKSTKYIKLCYSGNYSGNFNDVKVTDQAYVNDPMVEDAVITALDFGANTISSGVEEQTFNIEWCNVNALSVTCDNALFSVSPASFGGKAKYGTQTITVGYDRNQEIGAHNGTITISNGSVTKTVTVSGSTTKREQEIHWNADLVATSYTMNAEDALTGSAIATADNEEAVLKYISRDEAVIAVSPDSTILSAVANGTVTIVVIANGNDIYNEKIDSAVFTVTSDKKQTITWEQNFMGLKTNENPNTIELTATATSGGVITYALEAGSENCVILGGENNSTMTITGTPGVAYIIATQAGGEIDGETWISATARKQVKVRDPNSACDEYALADESFTFTQGHKSTFAVQEYNLIGQPTQLTFTAKAGGKQYIWSEREPIYIDQYANFGSGLEWKQVQAITLDENSKNYGPYVLNETATKIRFRSGDYSQQAVSNISIPRKKELVVSETAIVEDAERNVRWSKTISVSRSNIDVVDITVVSDDTECPFEVSKTSIGTDCADRSTETFEVYITPRAKGQTYTGTITITDGKAVPTTHTISLSVTATAFNQTIYDFVLPDTAMNTDTISFHATASSGLEVTYLSSDSTIAYVVNDTLLILKTGAVDITAYQAGDDRYNEASITKTLIITKEPEAQEIQWNEILFAMAVGENRAMTAWATSGLTVTYSSSDETVAYFDGNVLYAVAAGTITITASQAGNNEWFAAENVERQITINALPLEEPDIYWDPEATEITEGQALSESQLQNGEASVEGEFRWVDGTQILTVGSHWVSAVFVPNDLNTYKPVYMDVEVVVNVAPPVTALDEQYEDAKQAQKIFYNGRIYIRHNDQLFDLSGQLVR